MCRWVSSNLLHFASYNNVSSFYVDYEENLAKQKAKREGELLKKSEADLARSQEEKRKMHKQIIDKIPIEKEDLFNHPLDRKEIDGTIKKKVQSWINKKIIEYIGEPEPTLVDFICSKLLAGSTPQSILDDVKMVRLFIHLNSIKYLNSYQKSKILSDDVVESFIFS